MVTDPEALAAIMGRGEGAMDKASLVYAPINRMCDPHGSPNLLTSTANDTWKCIRKAVAVSFSMQVRAAAAVVGAGVARLSKAALLLLCCAPHQLSSGVTSQHDDLAWSAQQQQQLYTQTCSTVRCVACQTMSQPGTKKQC